MFRAFVYIIALSISSQVLAWDGKVAGKIKSIDVTSAQNYAFRVSIEGISAFCEGGASWGYLNESDSNYFVYVSALLSAKDSESTVTVYSTKKNSGENTYCRIGYISVH